MLPGDGFWLTEDDPDPFVIRAGGGGIVLCCEHGGRALPACLALDAPPPEDMNRHIAWDVGAAAVADRVAARLGAPLATQPYSRLVIDSNRPRQSPDLAPPVSDGSRIPFNSGLTETALDVRWAAIHQPFHAAVAALIDAGRPHAFASIHSFSPRLRGGPARPMSVGLLVRRDPAFADAIFTALARLTPADRVVMNEPYRIEDESDYTIPVHAEARGLDHALIEIRNDLISDEAGLERWSGLIAEALAEATTATENR